MSQRARARVEVERPRCPYCRDAVGPDDAKTGCGACMAWHHRACWSEHGRCATCGAADAAGATPAQPIAAATVRVAEARRAADRYPVAQEEWNSLVKTAVGAAILAVFVPMLVWSLTNGADLVALFSVFVVGVGGRLTWIGFRQPLA